MFLVADFLFYDPCAVHGDGDRRSSDGIGKCWRCPTHFCLVLVGEWNGGSSLRRCDVFFVLSAGEGSHFILLNANDVDSRSKSFLQVIKARNLLN